MQLAKVIYRATTSAIHSLDPSSSHMTTQPPWLLFEAEELPVVLPDPDLYVVKAVGLNRSSSVFFAPFKDFVGALPPAIYARNGLT